MLHTERTTFGGQTGQGDLEVDTSVVGASQGENIACDVALAVGSKSGNVSNASGVVALNSSIAQLAGDRCSVRLSGHGSGQHSDGGNSLEDRRHCETGRRRIECRERGCGRCARESLSRFERVQETVDARDADSKEGTGRNANAVNPGYLGDSDCMKRTKR